MRTHNLFISHSWAYGDQYKRLVGLLRARRYFRFRNYSVPKDDPIHNAPTSPALRRAIKAKMNPCGVVLILAGVYATYSDWIDQEIELAQEGFRNRKPIIAIKPLGSQRISVPVQQAADRVVSWRTESIVQAIRACS